jgi:hypothetical protein
MNAILLLRSASRLHAAFRILLNMLLAWRSTPP